MKQALVATLAVVLLQPPGYCLCRLSAPAAPRPAPASGPPRGCRCCRPQAAPAAPADLKPAPPRFDHLPGCPQADTAALARAAPAAAPPALAPALLPLLPLGPTASPPPVRPAPTAAPPLRC